MTPPASPGSTGMARDSAPNDESAIATSFLVMLVFGCGVVVLRYSWSVHQHQAAPVLEVDILPARQWIPAEIGIYIKTVLFKCNCRQYLRRSCSLRWKCCVSVSAELE